MNSSIFRLANAVVFVSVLSGVTIGCAQDADEGGSDSAAVTTGAKSVEQRASYYQPFLEAFHRKMLASKLDPVDPPANESDPRTRIPIFANKGAIWDLVVHDKTDYLVNTTQLIGEEWFVASALVETVKKNGGPYELSAQEKMAEKYEDSVVSALTDRIVSAAGEGKNAQPDAIDAALIKRLEQAALLFEFDRESMHGRVVALDKKLFAKVAESEHLVAGWYSVGKFED